MSFEGSLHQSSPPAAFHHSFEPLSMTMRMAMKMTMVMGMAVAVMMMMMMMMMMMRMVGWDEREGMR